MTLDEIKLKAKGQLGGCESCKICDGRACKNNIPGPGAKGSGTVAIKNFDAWKNIDLNIDTIAEGGNIDTSIELFGKKFDMPVFAGPISNVRVHYSKLYTEEVYADLLVSGTKEAGICAFTGEATDKSIMEAGLAAIKKNGGLGIPTVKPFAVSVVKETLKKVKDSGAFAVAMDVDAVGIKGLNYTGGVATTLCQNELADIIKSIDIPFIVKGIMTVKGAKKAIDAGAKGIVVSNHGGRVLDGTAATATVLKEIADAVKGKCKIFVDGGVRDGIDVFKAIALGADAVLIARPFVQVMFGDKETGIKTYVNELQSELKETMNVCGARKLSDISFDMVKV